MVNIQTAEYIAQGIGVLGMAIIVWGVLVGFVEIVSLELSRLKGEDICRKRELVRQDVGYYILLSLEFLIAADIIHTTLNRTLSDLAVLGSIVAIRTVVSFFLTREMRESDRLAAAGGSAEK